MAGRTLRELTKRQDDARIRAASALSTVVTGKKTSAKEASKEVERMIAEQGTRLEATKAAQAASNFRFEREIKAREERIGELQALAERLKHGTDGSTRPEKPTRPSGSTRLQDVTGIGRAAERKLKAGGIRDLRALSQAEPDEVAELLGVSREKATTYVNEAKRLSRR